MFLLQYINYVAKDSEKKRDAIACLIIVMVGMFVGIVMHLVNPSLDYLLLPFEHSIHYSINAINSGNTLVNIYTEYYEVIQQINMNLDKSFVEMIIFSLIVTALFFFMLFFVRLRRGWLILLIYVLELTITAVMFIEVRILIILTAILLLMMQRLIPLGDGFYYKIIQYAFYIPNIYKRKERKKISVIKIILQGVFLLILGVVFAMLLNSVLSYLSVKVSFLLFIAMVILVWMNQCTDLTTKIIRKIISYSIIIMVVLLDNNSFEIGNLSPILALVSIFFAVERVIALVKELAKRIECESFLFLCEEINDCEELLEQRLEIPMEIVGKLSEDMLTRQILINFKLGFESKAMEMIEVYKSQRFNKELHIIHGIEYEILFKDGEISIEEAEVILAGIFSQVNKGLGYWKLNCDYAYILYLKDKDYGKIVDLLEEKWLLLDDEMKYILYYALSKQDIRKSAEAVKREISNFEEVKQKVDERKKEVISNKMMFDEG
ncbi:MAG: hypothetical protein HFG82_09520 [Dorea sp.]|jgi:hypothetical protein|nr:hypothetical protein [Dorea sp.]